ncbi:polymorphic toxin-type HINT domain-containing protein [Streptomyces sp. NPDC002550]
MAGLGELGRKLTATYEHPFWNPSQSRWVKARDLRPGSTLLSNDGSTVRVQVNRAFDQRVRTYNLTVEDFHTYYVPAGSTPASPVWVITNSPTNRGGITHSS